MCFVFVGVWSNTGDCGWEFDSRLFDVDLSLVAGNEAKYLAIREKLQSLGEFFNSVVPCLIKLSKDEEWDDWLVDVNEEEWVDEEEEIARTGIGLTILPIEWWWWWWWERNLAPMDWEDIVWLCSLAADRVSIVLVNVDKCSSFVCVFVFVYMFVCCCGVPNVAAGPGEFEFSLVLNFIFF